MSNHEVVIISSSNTQLLLKVSLNNPKFFFGLKMDKAQEKALEAAEQYITAQKLHPFKDHVFNANTKFTQEAVTFEIQFIL